MLTGLICVCVCVCVGTVNGVFIYCAQKEKWFCDLMREADAIFSAQHINPLAPEFPFKF